MKGFCEAIEAERIKAALQILSNVPDRSRESPPLQERRSEFKGATTKEIR